MDMFIDTQKILDKIQTEITPYYGMGKVASYIPELALVEPKQFSMSVVDLNSMAYNTGAADTFFSIQSISKVYVLTMAMKILGDKLWERVGKEPSGNPFNSLVQLESEGGIPRNPFINAGALVTTDAIIEVSKDPYQEILDFVRQISGNPTINYNKKVAKSEFDHSERNAALAFFMKSFGNIRCNPLTVLDVYFHHCSIEMTTLDLARSFLFLANHGVIPSTGEKVVEIAEAKRINSLMLTCGLYDNCGDFAYRVGLPAKSGVGGAIVAVLPGHFASAVWSPELNKAGNSLIGTVALEKFTTETGLSIF